MSQLDKLLPQNRQRVMDLVASAGIDVSDWANFKGGKKSAASNPKYCYEWSFVQQGGPVVLNIWHAHLKESHGLVSVTYNHRKYDPRMAKISVWASRSKKFDLAIQDAIKHRYSIRMIINEGTRRKPNEAKASHVDFRFLDTLPWSVQSYNWQTGECTLVRGEDKEHFIDQFSLTEEQDSPTERKDISGTTFVRNPAHRLFALNRAKGTCEYCGNSGFKMENGKLFLETHHVIPLSEGGSDSRNNVTALCPNHHREAHHGVQAKVIQKKLLSKLQKKRNK